MSDRDPSPCPFCGCEAEIIRGTVYCRGPNDCASASPEDWERVATATEAAEAARDKALEDAIAEVTHVTSTAHDARVLALAAKRIELLRAKLRAAKEER